MDETATPTDPPHWRDLLGPEIGWLSVCGFLADLGSSARCGKPAKWHLWLEDGEGYAGACDGHINVARAILRVQDEHSWGRWCNLPGSIWYQQPPMSWCEQEHGDPLEHLDLATPQPHEQELAACC